MYSDNDHAMLSLSDDEHAPDLDTALPLSSQGSSATLESTQRNSGGYDAADELILSEDELGEQQELAETEDGELEEDWRMLEDGQHCVGGSSGVGARCESSWSPTLSSSTLYDPDPTPFELNLVRPGSVNNDDLVDLSDAERRLSTSSEDDGTPLSFTPPRSPSPLTTQAQMDAYFGYRVEDVANEGDQPLGRAQPNVSNQELNSAVKKPRKKRRIARVPPPPVVLSSSLRTLVQAFLPSLSPFITALSTLPQSPSALNTHLESIAASLDHCLRLSKRIARAPPRAPTQAQVDDFFNFVPAVGPAPAIEEDAKDLSDPPKWEKPIQLQAINPHSSITCELLTVDEKRLAIIQALEDVALSILTQLVYRSIPELTQDPSTVAGKKRADPDPVVVVLAKRVGASTESKSSQSLGSLTRRLVFPRRRGYERSGGQELAAFLKTIELILGGLRTGSVATKRDLFYRSVKIFVKQATLDTLVEDVAATLQVRRADLNVVAAAKGLFAGHLKIICRDGVVLEGGNQGALIPPTQLIDRIEADAVRWILVIEKEAVFQSLCCSAFLKEDERLKNGIIVTGKGYPDLSTRELVKRLSIALPLAPILCLVDSDPHGLDILSTYKFGSSAMAFDAVNLVADRIEWLGVKGSEWDGLGVPRSELLPLTKGDRKKALTMLKRPAMPNEWKYELEYMLHMHCKAEIQVLSSANVVEVDGSQSTSPLLKHVSERIIERLRW